MFRQENKMTAKQINEIESLRAQGFGYKKIASEMGVSENTIKSFFRRITRSTTKQERVTSRTTPYQDNPQSNGGCLYCGKPIVQPKGRKEKKFCSDQCRAHWWNRHKTTVPGKNRISGICPTCGNEFFTYIASTRKYCSHECYIAGRFYGRQVHISGGTKREC